MATDTALGLGARVFVSSTFLDNEDRRRIVKDAILTAKMVPAGMERFTTSNRPTVVSCIKAVRRCQLFIGIVAYRYGWIPDDEMRSITEIEYDAAGESGIPRLMFLPDPNLKVNPNTDFDRGRDRWTKQSKLDAFKARITDETQMPCIFTEANLGTKILHAINEELSAPKATARRTNAEGPGPAGYDDWRPGRTEPLPSPPQPPLVPTRSPPDSRILQDLVYELARIFFDSNQARRLARLAGVPETRLPAFRTPLMFWSSVMEYVEAGGAGASAQSLVNEAVRQYPNNQTLKRYQS